MTTTPKRKTVKAWAIKSANGSFKVIRFLRVNLEGFYLMPGHRIVRVRIVQIKPRKRRGEK